MVSIRFLLREAAVGFRRVPFKVSPEYFLA